VGLGKKEGEFIAIKRKTGLKGETYLALLEKNRVLRGEWLDNSTSKEKKGHARKRPALNAAAHNE